MLYIMRHGRTVWNMEHKLQGKTDVPLSEAGRPVVEQAAAAAGKGHPDRGPRCHEREHCVPDQGHPREGLLEREDEKRGAGAAALSASL